MNDLRAQQGNECSPVLALPVIRRSRVRCGDEWCCAATRPQGDASLFKEIIAQRPAELFLLGDVVNLDIARNDGQYIDTR